MPQMGAKMRRLLHCLRPPQGISFSQNPNFHILPRSSSANHVSSYSLPSLSLPQHASRSSSFPNQAGSITRSFIASLRSWQPQNRRQVLYSSIGVLARPTPLGRLLPTTHLPSCARKLSPCWSRLFHFSSQKRSLLHPYPIRRTSWRSIMSTPETVLYGLIGANVFVFMLWRLVDTRFMERHFMISLDNIKCWRLHTLVTSAFSHMDADHIFTNMFGLFIFGNSIGTLFGPQFLLKMYLAGAVSGSIFFILHKALVSPSLKGWGRQQSSVQGLGASGAVNAIMLFYIFLFPKNIIYLQLFIPLPAAAVGAILIGTDLWRVKQGDTHVSGSAHLGGAMVAALAWARFVKHWI